MTCNRLVVYLYFNVVQMRTVISKYMYVQYVTLVESVNFPSKLNALVCQTLSPNIRPMKLSYSLFSHVS